MIVPTRCPKCNGPIEPGYGAAGGDGIGLYWVCVSSKLPKCGWTGKKLGDLGQKEEEQ